MFDKLKDALLIWAFLFVAAWPEITTVAMLAACGLLYRWSL